MMNAFNYFSLNFCACQTNTGDLENTVTVCMVIFHIAIDIIGIYRQSGSKNIN